MQLQIVTPEARIKRKMRKPRLDVGAISYPYGISMAGFHPVLPGETLKSMWGSLTFVSDPLKDKLQGGWIDVMGFYVKHSQLDIADDLLAMHVDGTTLPTTPSAGNRQFVTPAGGVSFVQRCYDLVVEWYFRDSDEALTPATGLIAGCQPAQIGRETWMNSLKLASSAPTSDELLPGQNPEQPTDNVVEATYSTHWTQWTRMRALGYSSASFEDYLIQQGAKGIEANNDEERRRPELLVHQNEYVGPSNTVEPSTGVPSTAHVKTVQLQLKRARHFQEPGWIIFVAVWRPKVHFANVTGTAAAFMTEADDWFPAALEGHPYTSLKSFAEGTGPAPIQTTGDSAIWVDMRDLLLYGEQQYQYDYNNTATATTARATAKFAPALPDATGNWKYLTETQARAVFNGDPVTDTLVMRMDGVLSFEIASQIGEDTTP